MTQEFHREDRYIVIKHKDLGNVPVAYREHLVRPLFALQAHLPVRECVVVESDWPEYETVWRMIEARVTAVTPAGVETSIQAKRVSDSPAERLAQCRSGDLASAGGGVDFGIDGRSVHVSQEAYSIFLAREQMLKERVSALQQRLTITDQRVDDLEKDKQRLDALETNFWDVRHNSAPLADTGDYTGGVEIVGRWMDKPHERVIGEDYNESLRAAIDQAMTAGAYPPARPEYPDIDAALSEENWHMNPCKQGHSDVGACGGKAFCHTCDETITATTTQEVFEMWNATHPASPQ